jgi:hypothetical protein
VRGGKMSIFNRNKPKQDSKNTTYIIEKLELGKEYASGPLGDALSLAIENLVLEFKKYIREVSDKKVIEVKNLITFDGNKISLPNKIKSGLEDVVDLLKNKGIIDIHDRGYRLSPNWKIFLLGYLRNMGVLEEGFSTRDMYN